MLSLPARSAMARGAEGAVLDQWGVRRELVGDGVDAGDIQRLVDGHARQDARHGPRQQRLARAGRADHQHVMPTGGDLLPLFGVPYPLIAWKSAWVITGSLPGD